MAASDYVVVAAPLTPETRGSVGEAEIGAMKPEAVLINIGRGPVVDERALVRALEEKRIRGAASGCLRARAAGSRAPLLPARERAAIRALRRSHRGLAGALDGSLPGQLRAFPPGLPLRNVVDKRGGY